MTIEQIHRELQEIKELLFTGTNFIACENRSRALLDAISLEDNPTHGEDRATVRCQTKLALAEALWRRGAAKESLLHAHEAKSEALRLHNQELEASAYSQIAIAHSMLSEYSQALDVLHQAIKLNEERSSQASLIGNFGNLGIVYSLTSDFPQAMEYSRKALELAEQLGDKGGISKNLGSIGNVFFQLSEYSDALEYYVRALVVNEELGHKHSIAANTGNIGIVYHNLGNDEQALAYLGKSLALFEEVGDKSGVARQKGFIASIYINLSQYEGAFEYLGAALALAEEIGEKTNTAVLTSNIGNLYAHRHEFDKALEQFSKASELFEEVGNAKAVATTFSNVGFVYANRDFIGYNAEKAEEKLLLAIKMLEELNVKKEQIEIHSVLSTIYKDQERWKDSLVHHEKFHELSKEFDHSDAKKRADQMELRKQIVIREREVAVERAAQAARIEEQQKLLHRMLPAQVAHRLLNGEKVADYFQNVSVLFADIVGFTPIAARMPARAVIAFLNYVFSEFDSIIKKHGCEKIKTIGDGYMAVAGAPVECSDHAERLARAALDMMNDIHLPDDIRSSLPKETVFHIRIGLHCGSAFGGIVGDERFVYDVYSDAVNLAARMESSGEPGRIHCSSDFYAHVHRRDTSYVFTERGEIDIKGKGLMRTYFLESQIDA